MPSVRKVTTGSGAVAVQVVRYDARKVVVMKHLGSTHLPEELPALIARANAWIAETSEQQVLFPQKTPRMLDLAHAHYRGIRYSFAYQVLNTVLERMGFCALESPLLLDLALMRIIEPSSKLRAITLLERYFGITYAARTVYRTLPKLVAKKQDVERIAVAFAREQLSHDLTLVLYDVTTLYFESFEGDDLRVPGFSKDNKSQQPQIVVGLLVTRDGFPLGHEVFKGNTFEGHTMLPILESFAHMYHVTTPVVVADAAMLSRENVQKLQERGHSYIVGARLANASPRIIKQVSLHLAQEDGASVRVTTEHGDLVCGFSAKRYRKDLHELEKQVARANELVRRGEPGRRAKYVTKGNEVERYALNSALVEKTKLLLGIKGYYTNIPETTLTNTDVIARYHDLWNVEASFRMAKSDLATRPIFHHREDAVRAHLLVCFVALACARYCEQVTGLSVRALRDVLWSVTDAQIVDTMTGETIMLRSEIGTEAESLLRQLGLSH